MFQDYSSRNKIQNLNKKVFYIFKALLRLTKVESYFFSLFWKRLGEGDILN